MKLEIEPNEHTDVLATCLDSALMFIKEEAGHEYLVIHNGDGACFKVGMNNEIGLWLSKFTEDDEAVQ